MDRPNESVPGQAQKNERDPIEWAIVAVIISGSSLILSLESKIEARRRAEKAEVQRKAVSANRVRLAKMSRHLGELKALASRIREISKLVVQDGKTGIMRGSLEFDSEERAEEFNRLYEMVTHVLARLNRLLSEIDTDGLPLTEEDVKKLALDPFVRIQGKIEKTLHPATDPHDRFKLLDEVLSDYATFVADIDAALGRS